MEMKTFVSLYSMTNPVQEVARIEIKGINAPNIGNIHKALNLLGYCQPCKVSYTQQEGKGWGKEKILWIDPSLEGIDEKEVIHLK
jgi:hypothetical protein